MTQGCLVRLAAGAALVLASLSLAGCDDGIEEAWHSSAHADTESSLSQSLAHWDAEGDPMPAGCARCHTTGGVLEFLDAKVPEDVTQGTTIQCAACHNDVADDKHDAVMPSGVELAGVGASAICMTCHQGRASGHRVSETLAGLEYDRMNRDLSFISPHNNAAGPIQYGTIAGGGYEYEGESYRGRFNHVLDSKPRIAEMFREHNACIACHDPHTLAVNARKCSGCHLGVRAPEDFASIRLTNVDYDGDGDRTDGIASEIQTLKEDLLKAMRVYAFRTKDLDPLVHKSYPPYFFNDADQPYHTWTPRLLRAAYNYQFVHISSDAFAHNPKYTIQLLYDSLSDLGAKTRAMTRP